MTTFTRTVARATTAFAIAALAGSGAWAQTPPPTQTSGQQDQRPAGRPGQRGMGPGGELNVQNVQNMVDAWALVQAEKELELTNEQYPNFVARMTRLQSARRRHMMERQRTLRELRAIAFGASPRPEDAVMTEKVRAFDELHEKGAQELRKLAADVDGVLTPYQRARFRLFEEQIERQKLDMLIRARAAGRGGV